MSFTDIDGYYLPAEVDAKFDEAQAEIDELKCELTILLKLSTVNMTDDHVKRVKKLLEK